MDPARLKNPEGRVLCAVTSSLAPYYPLDSETLILSKTYVDKFDEDLIKKP